MREREEEDFINLKFLIQKTLKRVYIQAVQKEKGVHYMKQKNRKRKAQKAQPNWPKVLTAPLKLGVNVLHS